MEGFVFLEKCSAPGMGKTKRTHYQDVSEFQRVQSSHKGSRISRVSDFSKVTLEAGGQGAMPSKF